jgi:hypothetical protein
LPIKLPSVISPEITPSEYIQARRKKSLSFTPPQQDLSSSDEDTSDDSDDDSLSDEDEKVELDDRDAEADDEEEEDDSDDDDEDDVESDSDDDDDENEESRPATPVRIYRRTSIIVQHTDRIVDFTIEELSPNDMNFDSDTSLIQPTQLQEDPSSESASSDSSDSDSNDDHSSDSDTSSTLADELCGLHLATNAIDSARQERYLRRKRRWKRGGNRKRRHDASCGPGCDHADIIPLDDDPPIDTDPQATPVGEGRRLRRRTDEPVTKPRMSMILERGSVMVGGLGGCEEVVLGDEDGEDPDEVMPPAWLWTTEMDIDRGSGEPLGTGRGGRVI